MELADVGMKLANAGTELANAGTELANAGMEVSMPENTESDLIRECCADVAVIVNAMEAAENQQKKAINP